MGLIEGVKPKERRGLRRHFSDGSQRATVVDGKVMWLDQFDEKGNLRNVEEIWRFRELSIREARLAKAIEETGSIGAGARLVGMDDGECRRAMKRVGAWFVSRRNRARAFRELDAEYVAEKFLADIEGTRRLDDGQRDSVKAVADRVWPKVERTQVEVVNPEVKGLEDTERYRKVVEAVSGEMADGGTGDVVEPAGG